MNPMTKSLSQMGISSRLMILFNNNLYHPCMDWISKIISNWNIYPSFWFFDRLFINYSFSDFTQPIRLLEILPTNQNLSLNLSTNQKALKSTLNHWDHFRIGYQFLTVYNFHPIYNHKIIALQWQLPAVLKKVLVHFFSLIS